MPDLVAQARAGGLPLFLIVALKGAELAASWGGKDTSSAPVLRSLLEDRGRALQQCEARGLELELPVCNASEAEELLVYPDIATFRTSLSCFLAGLSLEVLRALIGLCRRCLGGGRRRSDDEREHLERSEVNGPRRPVMRGRGVVE